MTDRERPRNWTESRLAWWRLLAWLALELWDYAKAELRRWVIRKLA